MNDKRLEIMLRKNYRLTTAEILYHFPDHPDLLQSYIWQELDIAPKFPELTQFLDFWERELDGKLHSVRVDHFSLVEPNEWLAAKAPIVIH